MRDMHEHEIKPAIDDHVSNDLWDEVHSAAFGQVHYLTAKQVDIKTMAKINKYLWSPSYVLIDHVVWKVKEHMRLQMN